MLTKSNWDLKEDLNECGPALVSSMKMLKMMRMGETEGPCYVQVEGNEYKAEEKHVRVLIDPTKKATPFDRNVEKKEHVAGKILIESLEVGRRTTNDRLEPTTTEPDQVEASIAPLAAVLVTFWYFSAMMENTGLGRRWKSRTPL
jgi:hypothetical protein